MHTPKICLMLVAFFIIGACGDSTSQNAQSKSTDSTQPAEVVEVPESIKLLPEEPSSVLSDSAQATELAGARQPAQTELVPFKLTNESATTEDTTTTVEAQAPQAPESRPIKLAPFPALTLEITLPDGSKKILLSEKSAGDSPVGAQIPIGVECKVRLLCNEIECKEYFRNEEFELFSYSFRQPDSNITHKFKINEDKASDCSFALPHNGAWKVYIYVMKKSALFGASEFSSDFQQVEAR